jgi:hypothetical protein
VFRVVTACIIAGYKGNASLFVKYSGYDTETIDKVVKLVVTLEYEIGR